MASHSWTYEIESRVEASRLFKAAVLDRHKLGPKLMPEVIVSGEVIGGEGVGAVFQIKFSPAVPYGYVKEWLDYFGIRIKHFEFVAKAGRYYTLVAGKKIPKRPTPRARLRAGRKHPPFVYLG